MKFKQMSTHSRMYKLGIIATLSAAFCNIALEDTSLCKEHLMKLKLLTVRVHVCSIEMAGRVVRVA